MLVCSFPCEKEHNSDYLYAAGNRKKVMLMGTKAFVKFLASIKACISTLIRMVQHLEMRVNMFKQNLDDSSLAETEQELADTTSQIAKVKEFYIEVTTHWSKPENRVIGYVVWAPPIALSAPPHGSTTDVCVIKLDKKKFPLPNFRGNLLNLGVC